MTKTRLMALPSWNQVCSALDIINDCVQAIDAYWSLPDDSPLGMRYLTIIGLLEAFYLQQDAVEDLAKAITGSSGVRDNEPLRRIREVRNACASHTTRRRGRKGGVFATHLITRIFLTKTRFQYLTWDKFGSLSEDWVDVAQSTREQVTELTTELDRVEAALTPAQP